MCLYQSVEEEHNLRRELWIVCAWRVCLYMLLCVGARVCGSIWRAEVPVGCFLPSPFTVFSEIGCLPILRAHGLASGPVRAPMVCPSPCFLRASLVYTASSGLARAT